MPTVHPLIATQMVDTLPPAFAGPAVDVVALPTLRLCTCPPAANCPSRYFVAYFAIAEIGKSELHSILARLDARDVTANRHEREAGCDGRELACKDEARDAFDEAVWSRHPDGGVNPQGDEPGDGG